MNPSSTAAPPFATRTTAWARSLVARKRLEPSYPPLPLVDASRHQSNVKGLYMIGEVAGEPLIKVGLNRGVEAIETIAADLAADSAASSDASVRDVIIVGAGCAGLSATFAAKAKGLSYLTLDGQRTANLIRTFTKGKPLFAEPHGLANASELWFEECSKEELLERWDQQLAEAALDIHEFEKVTDIQRRDGHFEVTTDRASYRARRVLVAIGKAGNPRKAGVPGEIDHAARIAHHLADPDDHHDRDCFIYGGGDVALEAAIHLASVARSVTLATIDREFVFPKKRNVDRLRALETEGKVTIHLDTRLDAVDADGVTVRNQSSDETTDVPAQSVFEMIGAELPLGFFKKIGVKLEGTWDAGRWLALAVLSVLVYSLYALKKFPDQPYSWPFRHLFSAAACITPDGVAVPAWNAAVCIDGGHALTGFYAGLSKLFTYGFAPFAWLFSDQALAEMRATPWFQQGYLYSLLYTIVMVVFGWQALVRWQTHPNTKTSYQKWRYLSLISFQVVFFLMANVIAVQAMSIQNAWRAWGLYQPWPLFFNTFHWFDESDPRAVVYLFGGFGLFLVAVFMPIMSRFHGKRFCTWICGCGGLAETLGDRWRHLAAKGPRSRSWEFQGVLVLIAATLATLVTVGMYQTQAVNSWAKAYSYIVDFWLVAVIPIALYPFFGGKVWCRYWCPLAAYNQLLSAWFGKLRITSNEKCISCTQCSRYCQVGVDVMAFAKNQQAFDNKNSACIHCGICIDVCPMNVLEFDSAGELQIPDSATVADHRAA